MRQAELPEETLMRLAAQGDTAAFDTLLCRHENAVFHYLTRLTGEVALAEDLAQDCWLRVWRARHAYRPRAAFRTWLFTIARRLALDHAKAPRLAAAPLPDDLPGASDLCEQVFAAILEQKLEYTLARMPLDLREAVVLRDMEGMSYVEIAQITGCPLGTVKSRINAGRARLQAVARAWLKEEAL